MTDVLYDLLSKRFPAIDGDERVSAYENFERIHLNLFDLVFKDAPSLTDHSKIEQLAKLLFEVNFEYKPEGNVGPSIFFYPSTNKKPEKFYANHYVQVQLPSKFPIINIVTGNRGESVLELEQRKKYFTFVEQVYDLFLQNAK